MNETATNSFMPDIQGAADLLVEAAGDQEHAPNALGLLAAAILEHCGETVPALPDQRLFSPELPLDAQQLAAVWLVWSLSRESKALDFADAQRLTASLCDRAISPLYPSGVTGRTQTFEKLQALEQVASSIISEAGRIVDQARYLEQVEGLRSTFLRFLNQERNALFLRRLLPLAVGDKRNSPRA